MDNLDMLDECPKVGAFHPIPRYEYIWVCKDGTEINIKDISLSHLQNSIAIIEKSIKANRPWREDFLEAMTRELKSRIK